MLTQRKLYRKVCSSFFVWNRGRNAMKLVKFASEIRLTRSHFDSLMEVMMYFLAETQKMELTTFLRNNTYVTRVQQKHRVDGERGANQALSALNFIVRVNQEIEQFERDAEANRLTVLLKLFAVKLEPKSGTGDNYLKHHVRYGLTFWFTDEEKINELTFYEICGKLIKLSNLHNLQELKTFEKFNRKPSDQDPEVRWVHC
jgi:hypothetical protein